MPATVTGSVGTRVVAMAGLVDGIAAAVDGSASMAQGDTDVTGSSRMAEELRSEMTGSLAQMRNRAPDLRASLPTGARALLVSAPRAARPSRV